MAKILEDYVQGAYRAYTYQLHYMVKKNAFEARFVSDELKTLAAQMLLTGKDPEEVKSKFKKLVEAYELTLTTDWKLWIVYKFIGNAYAKTQIESHSESKFKNELRFDFMLVYYTANDSHYIEKEVWDRDMTHRDGKHSPNAVYGSFDPNHKHRPCLRIEHTPELEAFFDSVSDGMATLYNKMLGVLLKPDQMILMASKAQKLLK